MSYQYYSNLGCDYLEHGESSRAYEALRTSLRILHGGIVASGGGSRPLSSATVASPTTSPSSSELKQQGSTTETPNSQQPRSPPASSRRKLVQRRSAQSSMLSSSSSPTASSCMMTVRPLQYFSSLTRASNSSMFLKGADQNHHHACGGGLALQIRGFYLTLTDGVSFSNDAHVEVQIASALVVFNLGLVHHLASLAGCGQDHARAGGLACHTLDLILKARALYVQSLRLLVSAIEPYNGMATGNETVDLLYMNLLNNLAIISMECSNDLQEPHQLYSRLVLLALSVKYDQGSCCAGGAGTTGTTAAAVTTHDVGSLVDEQLEAFLSNAAMLGFYCPSHASAA